MNISLAVNGEPAEVNSDLSKPLLWVLREELSLTGTKYGCGIGTCGACTVHIDGVATRSCVLPVEAAAGSAITTIEGLASKGHRHPLQRVWIETQVPQCGYCQSGMIMAAAALLAQNPDPGDEEIDATITNLCRCGTYPRVRRAIRQLAGKV